MAIKTYTDEDLADATMRRHNRTHPHSLAVLVDGPGPGQWTIMDLKSATDADFLYRWSA